MKYIPLDIPDVLLIEPRVFKDLRGFFMETWRDDGFKKNVGNFSFVQANHSKSSQGTLRGLHYQIRQPQGKLVRVIAGEVFDVAVDIRKHSLTFGQWVGTILSSENKSMLWVPPGFAHGFYVLSKEAEITYQCTDYYAPEYERCILYSDAAIGIDWPVISGTAPILSLKDEAGVTLDRAEVFS